MNDHSVDHPHDAPDAGHDHALGHGHTHGIVDPSIASTGRGLWAIKWSFIGLAATAIMRLAVVFLSGSVALLADTIHIFGDAATAIPLAIAFWFSRSWSRLSRAPVRYISTGVRPLFRASIPLPAEHS
jgi:Co/Zn/Cd efflux system component